MRENQRAPVREQILPAAEAAVPAKGSGGTSIDELVAAVGISKSGFCYHVQGKPVLAKTLIQRYVDQDNRIVGQAVTRADARVGDPLQIYLIGLKMLAAIFDNLPNGHPGCMIACICNHKQYVDCEVREKSRHPAGMLSVAADGGIMLSRVTREPGPPARRMRR